MTDRGSRFGDDRGVSTTLGYTLTLSITVVLVAGLLAAGGTLVEDQRRTVVGDQLDVAGQQLAAGYEDADRLAGGVDNGTVRVNVWLPQSVADGQYTVRLVNHPTSDQPTRATVVAEADGSEVGRNTSFRTTHPVANRTVPGGPVTISYNDSDGDGVRELVLSERRDIAPEPPEAAPFGHDEVVYVDADTGELRSVAPSGEITRYGVDAAAIGPKQVDLDEDGLKEIPYVTSAKELRIVDEDGQTQTLATDAAFSPGDYTSLLTIGKWNGSTSVFYLNTTDTAGGQPSIYRVGIDGNTKKVTAEGNAIDAMAIGGIGDVDDDGDTDLVYVAGASQELWFVDGDGGGETYMRDVGANAGYGLGDLRQFRPDERDSLPFVSSSNEIRLYSGTASSSLTGGAVKAPVSGINWNDSTGLEIVYVGTDDNTLRFVTLGEDDSQLTDDDGNVITITADPDTGVA